MKNEYIKVFLADDWSDDRFLWESIIKRFGYRVEVGIGGQDVLDRIDEVNPQLLMLDLNMPEPNGHEVCKRLRQIPKYMNLPIIMLTSSHDLNDKLTSFEEGVDEYLAKDMDHQEIEKRIEAVLRRYQQNLDSNPLTYLPGNNAIQTMLQKKIDSGKLFAVAYADLDNFKAYNDKYGFVAGDKMLLFTGRLITEAINRFGNPDDFVGHVGGDDFVLVSTPEMVESVCLFITDIMGREIHNFYREDDKKSGFIISKNRQGRIQKFPFVTISIAIVTNENRIINSIAEVSTIATELKKLAKKKTGNTYVFDKRNN
ncbi:MAG: response regulator [Calditrichaceae bacterium]